MILAVHPVLVLHSPILAIATYTGQPMRGAADSKPSASHLKVQLIGFGEKRPSAPRTIGTSRKPIGVASQVVQTQRTREIFTQPTWTDTFRVSKSSENVQNVKKKYSVNWWKGRSSKKQPTRKASTAKFLPGVPAYPSEVALETETGGEVPGRQLQEARGMKIELAGGTQNSQIVEFMELSETLDTARQR